MKCGQAALHPDVSSMSVLAFARLPLPTVLTVSGWGIMLITPDRRVDPCLHSGHSPRPQLPPTHSNWVLGIGFEPRPSWASGFKINCCNHQATVNSSTILISHSCSAAFDISYSLLMSFSLLIRRSLPLSAWTDVLMKVDWIAKRKQIYKENNCLLCQKGLH